MPTSRQPGLRSACGIHAILNELGARQLGTPCAHTHGEAIKHHRWEQERKMLRAAFNHKNDGLALKLEGRLVGAWAVEVKSLLSRHFVSKGLLVDVSEITYIDSVGEQLFLWLRDLQAKFVAETCYARDVCERLQLDLNETLKEKETLADACRQRPRCFPRKHQCPLPPQKAAEHALERTERITKTSLNVEPEKP